MFRNSKDQRLNLEHLRRGSSRHGDEILIHASERREWHCQHFDDDDADVFDIYCDDDDADDLMQLKPKKD